MRANKRNVRVMVFEVQPAADSASPFDPSALCIHQVNVAESLTIKVQTSSWTLSKLYAPPKHNDVSGSIQNLEQQVCMLPPCMSLNASTVI